MRYEYEPVELIPIDARKRISMKEAAHLAGVTVRTIYEWRRRGTLIMRKIGGQWWTSIDAIRQACPYSDTAAGQRSTRPGELTARQLEAIAECERMFPDNRTRNGKRWGRPPTGARQECG